MTLAILLLCIAILSLEIVRLFDSRRAIAKAMAHQKEVEDATGLTAALATKRAIESGLIPAPPGFRMPKGGDA